MNRRGFLTRGLVLPLLGSVSAPLQSKELVSASEDTFHQGLFASAFTDANKQHHIGLLNHQGQLLWQKPLNERAHAPVFHPTQPIVAIVSRRPGFFITVYNTITGKHVNQITPSNGHHFYGHAVFSADGNRLITQENHYDSGEGKVFVRDWLNGRILNEWPSYGIGPHQSCLLNGTTLVVANGGLRTHPDNDRTILNMDSMQPNVAFISLEDGRLLHKVTHSSDLHQLSIRHLDINSDGKVALAFQYQGQKWEAVPLVGIASLGSEKIDYLPMPEPIRQQFKQYCGSVRFDASGNVLAVTTPRGGLVAFWSIKEHVFLSTNVLRDVCGVKASNKPHEFILSTGRGKLFHINIMEETARLVQKFDKVHWDNHLT
ncbi:DUF1513 domain-containing protein [Marinomonas sp. 2405UD68-3]|uniref:DUF1513 domain-containing protein n=1 Tax=Marinomonas sp. 2405UD68-3 TaxID=3391835 RepID=UPI0039C9922B